MSIPLLIETQSEVRRLLIAGSELAVEDFRLKKLLPQMQKAGERVPVFSRVSEAMERVVVPRNERTSGALLELATLVNAILYTQGQTGIEGELEEIHSAGLSFSTDIPYRRIKPVIEALTGKGSGRLEIIKAACDEGVFQDLRLVYPLISALDDAYIEIVEFAEQILEDYGTSIVPVVKNSIDFNGGKGHARRVELVSKLKGAEEAAFYLEAAEKGSVEVKASAIRALKDIPGCEPMLLELSRDRKKEIREASLFSLSYVDSDTAVQRLFEVFNSKDRSTAAYAVKASHSEAIARMLLEEGEKTLDTLLKSEKGFTILAPKVEPPDNTVVESFITILDCMEGKKDKETFEFLKKCLQHGRYLKQFRVNIKGWHEYETITGLIAHNLITLETKEAFEFLDSVQGKFDHAVIAYSFEAAIRTRDGEYVYDHYAKYLKQGRKSFEGQEILRMMDYYIDFEEPYRLTEYYMDRPQNDRIQRVRKEEIPWDLRWNRLLMELDETKLVCRLASKGDDKCIAYLLKKLEENMNMQDHRVKDLVRGLLQAGYPNTLDVVMKVLKFNFDKTNYYVGFYINDFARVLQFLPKESARVLEEFALNYQKDAAAKIFEVAQYLKNLM